MTGLMCLFGKANNYYKIALEGIYGLQIGFLSSSNLEFAFLTRFILVYKLLKTHSRPVYSLPSWNRWMSRVPDDERTTLSL